MHRQIIIYKNYFIDFYKKQDLKVQEKIEYVLDLIRFEKHVPNKFFRHLTGTDGIYEIRVITSFKSIRIFCFFDKGELVVLTNSFIKNKSETAKERVKTGGKIENRIHD